MMARYLRTAGAMVMGAFVALVPWLVAAAETAQEVSAAAEAHNGAEHSGGMPQLDVSTYLPQVFWLVVFFVVLYRIVSRKAVPQLSDIIRQREERIAGDLNQAAELRAEAEAAYEQYEASLAKAHAAAQKQVKEIRDRIAEEQAARLAEVDAAMARKVADAEKRIAEARARAMAEVENVAVESAQAATERLIGIKVGVDEARRALAVVRENAA